MTREIVDADVRPLTSVPLEALAAPWLLPLAEPDRVNERLRVSALYGLHVRVEGVDRYIVVRPVKNGDVTDVRLEGLCSRGSPFIAGFMFFQVRAWMKSFGLEGELYADVPHSATAFQMMLLCNLVPVPHEGSVYDGKVRFRYDEGMEQKGVIARMEDDARSEFVSISAATDGEPN